MDYSILRILLCGLALLSTTLQTLGAETQTDTGQTGTFSQRYPQYQLHINDLLEVNFDLTPEFNQSVRVAPDGYISLRGVSPVYVEGLTVTHAADTIKRAYATILHNPVISIVLKEYEHPFFIVTGEVQKPGKFDVGNQTTVAEAIGIAGGFTADAKHS